MRRSVLLVWLVTFAAAGRAGWAQPTREAGQAGCEPKHQSCVAECRAQYFAIDPKRAACTVNCADEFARCNREQAPR
jgi:hypothetical protein